MMFFRQWFRKKLRKKQRIYIIPTRMGGYLIGLIFLMFLLSIGYSNNLLLIFTLFLFGMNLIWLVQTHFHLHALSIQSIHMEDGHAEEPLIVHLRWKKTPRTPHSWEVEMEDDQSSFPVRIMTNNDESTVGEMTLEKRGFHKFIFIKVSTGMPFGLYQTSCYYKVDSSVYVFPKKLKLSSPLEHQFQELEGEYGNTIKGPHDFWALSPYQGEESKRISWKHYAKSGELVIKEGEEHTKMEAHFKLHKEPQDKEYILSKLATQMIFCNQSQIPFSFESTQKKFSLQSSEKHLKDCLRELSVC